MIPGRWFVTPHAVRRYRQRVRPDASRGQALAELALWSEIAERRGSAEWIAEGPLRLRLVVGRGEGPRPALLTVTTERTRPTWIALREDVAREFEAIQIADPWGEVERLAPVALAERRAQYAVERRERTAERERMLARARERARERRATELHRETLRRAHQAERAARVAGRTCPECGGTVTARKGRGPTPVYCSDRCNRRVASRNWWRRRKAAR